MAAQKLEIHQYLTFWLAEERYGINVGHIKEVLELPRITRVPRMPTYLNSVINLRGNVIPLLDLRLKFSLNETAGRMNTNVIVTEIPSFFHDDQGELLTIGIYTDGVDQVLDIEPGNIRPAPKIGVAVDTSFIAGMGKVQDEFVLLLALGNLLSEHELLSREYVGENA